MMQESWVVLESERRDSNQSSANEMEAERESQIGALRLEVVLVVGVDVHVARRVIRTGVRRFLVNDEKRTNDVNS
jgi:hypothetical protein